MIHIAVAMHIAQCNVNDVSKPKVPGKKAFSGCIVTLPTELLVYFMLMHLVLRLCDFLLNPVYIAMLIEFRLFKLFCNY
jgi:hypothetical protein